MEYIIHTVPDSSFVVTSVMMETSLYLRGIYCAKYYDQGGGMVPGKKMKMRQ